MTNKNYPSFSSKTLVYQTALLGVLLVLPMQAQATPNAPWEPQECPRSNHTDTYHGVTVADPYRWLEDIDSKATKKWIEGQVKQSEDYLSKLPGRNLIRIRLDEIQNYEKYGSPLERGRLFYSYNSGLQNQSVFCVVDDPVAAPDKVRILLDPNTMSSDGTVAISGMKLSEDGQYLAYGLAEAGSDWNVWHVLEVATGKTLDDELRWVKFSGAAWDGTNRGFYYSRYPAPKPGSDLKAVNRNHTLYYHKLGTPQSQDVKVFSLPERPDWNVSAETSENGRWLLVMTENPKTDKATIWVHRLDVPNSPFVELPNADTAHFYPIDIGEDGTLLVYSDYQADNYRVLSCDLNQSADQLKWKELIAEQSLPISGACRAGDYLFLSFYRDAKSQIVRYDLNGKRLGEVALPGIGSAGIAGARHYEKATYYNFTNFCTPNTIYRYDLETGESTLWKKPKLCFDSDQYDTEQVFFTSADGCRVPMFISCKKGLKKDGTIPVLMYGYGGFNIGLTPYFSTTAVKWMEMGGAYVVVNLRGGDEYGSKWHEMGTKTQKQNVFNDFIAAGHYLVDHKYTSPQRLAIMGGSNGGLLVGACMNQAPGLFGAAIPQVGVMDMLRFSKFTIGHYWETDYGDVNKEAEFKALYAYSPYHNVVDGTYYPPTLITTADHDDRVFPAHSFKYAAALQHAQAGDNPVLIRIETRAGHGSGKPTSKRLDEAADILAFLANALKMDVSPSALEVGTAKAGAKEAEDLKSEATKAGTAKAGAAEANAE